MMKKILVLIFSISIASCANAALNIIPYEDEDPFIFTGPTKTFLISSDADEGYWGWMELVNVGEDCTIDYDSDPVFTEAGNPAGYSLITYYPDYPGWYEFIVASMDPEKPILAGAHISVTFSTGDNPRGATLNIYASDAATLLTSHTFKIPEPLTIALLGFGGIFLRKRKTS